MDSRLDVVLKQVEKKYGKGTIIRGSQYPALPRFKSGIFSLDVEIGGGIPKGRILIFTGNESAGKSTVATKIIASAQKTCRECGSELKPNEDGELECPKCGYGANPLKAFYCDIEGTFDPAWFSALGGQTDDLYLFQPEFAEQAVDVVEAVIRTGEVDIIVVDSIAMMSPAVEIEKSAEDHLMGTHAKLVNRMMRSIQAGFNSLGVDNVHKPTVILINQLREKVGVMYGCNRGDVVIPFVDGTSARIRDVVNGKISKDVWGYDESTGEIRPAKITSWFNNGRVDSHADWVHIKTNVPGTSNGRAGTILTKDHLVMTEQGWTKAKDIKITDRLLSTYSSRINGTVENFLAGTLIGDCHIAKSGTTNGYLTFEDSQNEEYSKWKAQKLSVAFNFTKNLIKTPTGKTAIKWNSNKTYELGLLRKQLNKKRNVIFDTDSFTAMSLALWYMDAGSLHYGNYGKLVTIGAKRFKGVPDANVAKLLGNVRNLGVEATWLEKRGTLCIPANAQNYFFSMISKYVPACMQYKLPIEYRDMYEDFTLEYTEQMMQEFVPVVSIGKATYRSGLLDKYDIEVDGCHAYLSGNSRNGFVVHNSPDTMPGGKGQSFASSITLKFFARPSERLTESGGDKKEVGQQIRFNVEKNKTYPPHKQGIFTLYTDNSEEYGALKGQVDNSLSITKYAVRYGIVDKGGAWLTYHADNGEEFKIQGEASFLRMLDERMDIADEISNKVYAAVYNS